MAISLRNGSPRFRGSWVWRISLCNRVETREREEVDDKEGRNYEIVVRKTKMFTETATGSCKKRSAL